MEPLSLPPAAAPRPLPLEPSSALDSAVPPTPADLPAKPAGRGNGTVEIRYALSSIVAVIPRCIYPISSVSLSLSLWSFASSLYLSVGARRRRRRRNYEIDPESTRCPRRRNVADGRDRRVGSISGSTIIKYRPISPIVRSCDAMHPPDTRRLLPPSNLPSHPGAN